MPIDNTSIRSSEVQAFVSNKPNAIIRWGISGFAIILLGLLGVSYLVKYPDIVSTSAKLASVNAAKEVIARTDGKLTKLNYANNETVMKGSVLGFAESIAEPSSVYQVKAQVDTMQLFVANQQIDQLVAYFPNYQHQAYLNQLGELQANYQTFIQSFITFKDFISNGFYLRKKQMLLKDLAFIQNQQKVQNNQKELLQQDLVLSNETFNASTYLNNEKVISSNEYRIEHSKLISKKLSIPQIEAALLSSKVQYHEKQKEITELENQIMVQKNIFIQSLQTFSAQIQAWERQYVLKAPIDGTLHYTNFFQENQDVKNGQVLFRVEPENAEYFMALTIPQYNFGKVKLGQKVLLKFQAYPFEQFGAVEGQIEYINPIPNDSGYLAKVILPNGLKTNYGKNIYHYPGLSANAEIITDDLRLLQRFFNDLRKNIQR